ncbi:MAG: hypothetical protein JWO92_706 [Chitinophagaceae bacterium]|nr:hypothetical protein [Chitinophagaceae bacterium]
MKKILLCIYILLLVIKIDANGQAGFQSGRYYNYQYQINDRPISPPEKRFDYYGNYLGVYQWWQQAQWHSESGGQYIYVWSGGRWQYQWYNGTYYWYNWTNYEKYMGY